MAGLTPKQAAFVQEYLVDLNATQAAIRAGYSEDTAGSIGQENLTKPEIAAAVQQGMDARAARTLVTQDRTVQKLAAIAFTDIADVMGWDADGNALLVVSEDLTPDQRAAVKKFKLTRKRYENKVGKLSMGAWVTENIEVEMHDKVGALDKLMRHLNAYPPQKVEQTGPGGGPLRVVVEYED